MKNKWWSKLIARLLTEPSASVSGAATVIAAASLASRILGVFRDRVLASSLGAGDALDVYYAAFKVPDLLYNLLIVGALSAGFIPVFIASREKNANQHWSLVNNFLNLVIIIMAAASLFIIAFAPWLSHIIAPGFEPDKLADVTVLMRIIALSPLLLGVSAVMGGVLQASRQFFLYSLAPIFYNVGIIIGALFFLPHFGLAGLAWGVVLGAATHMLIQLPGAWFLGWRYQRSCRITPELKKIVTLMIPRTLALSITQLNLFVLTIIGSFLSAGTIAVFNLATNLFFVPVALFGISYALAVFPSLSEAAARKDYDLFVQQVVNTLKSILFLIIPSTVIYILLRAQIVRSVLGSGAFDWTDTVLTIDTLYWFSLAMFAHALIPLFVRAFYALHDTVRPLIAGVIGDGLAILAALHLTLNFDISGLAMAFSLGAIINLLILVSFMVLKFRHNLKLRKIIKPISIMLIGGVGMAFVVQGVKTGLGALFGTATFLAVITQGGLAIFAGLLTYALLTYLWHLPELIILVSAINRRVKAYADVAIAETEIP